MVTRGFHRYHALDALRASMMLLGLVLHSSASYVVAPLHEAWPYKDAATSTMFDLAVFFIHLFRMPVFFVVAGLFAAMLMQRDGARGLHHEPGAAGVAPARPVLAGRLYRGRRRLHGRERARVGDGGHVADYVRARSSEPRRSDTCGSCGT